MIRLLLSLLAVTATNGYTVLHQRSSTFVGREVYHSSPTTSSSSSTPATTTTRATLTMKKGKSNLPPAMRSQYARSKEMDAYRQQMVDSQTYKSKEEGGDGLPVFNLFVRTGLKNMWYPCGSFKGDEKSAALCDSIISNGFLAGVSRTQLDAGIGSSLFRDLRKLEDSVIRGYPQLRRERGKLEYGYKLSYDGLSEEQKKIAVVEIKEQKGWFDGVKSAFNFGGD